MSKSLNTFILISVPIFTIGLLAYLIGIEKTWQLFGIPTVIPDFIDSRVITAGSESFKMGFDPLIANPAMPTGNQMNYPRIWQLLFYFDLNQNHTIYLAVTCFGFYISGVFVICNYFKNCIEKFIFLIAAFSPSALLGIERGNVDLIIFGITVLAGQLFAITTVGSLIVLIFAFLLKLYPIFAIPYFIIMSGPKKITIMSLFMIILILLYFILKYDELILISNSTPRTFSLSYGKNVLYSALSYGLPLTELGLNYIYIAINSFFLFSSCLIIYAAYDLSKYRSMNHDSKTIVLFLAGASIYCGTFIIGNNFYYRLIFLLMVLPFFYFNTNNTLSYLSKNISIFMITIIFFTMWNITIMSHIDERFLRIILFAINQSAQWLIYYILLFSATIILVAKIKLLYKI